jgi:hypothetical protein
VPYCPDKVKRLDGCLDGMALGSSLGTIDGIVLGSPISILLEKHRQAVVKQNTTTNDLIVEDQA